jgi:hypothetical protein
MRRCANASWFEWTEGSAPFFWNWGKDYQREVRDGQPHYTTGALPIYNAPQRKHRDAVQHELMREKILGVRKREYICPGPVVSGAHYFCVPKGPDDVRMVYNGTSCGLNDVLFALRFGLPTVRHTLRAILPGYHQADLDVGEQFLNFCLHKSLREYSVLGGRCEGGQSYNKGGRRVGDRSRCSTHGTLGPQLDGTPRLTLSKPPMAGEVEVRGVRQPEGPE